MNPLQYAERIAYSSKETLHFTYETANRLKDMPGVYVECGVAAGAQIIAMAYGAPNKTIYAFDSFQGLPLPSNRDDQMPGIRRLTEAERKELPEPGKQVLESSGATSVSLEDFWVNIQESKVSGCHRIITTKGWFEVTLIDYCFPEQISLLRLDGDLYNSTFVCLKYLFPKVIKHGVVIIDDWQLPGCREACIDYFNSIKYVPKYQFISDIAFFEK
ncbi:MAG TPA: TylF/MycF/NovP-related O-methyltransferase [Chitinophagaceae bacterium]